MEELSFKLDHFVEAEEFSALVQQTYASKERSEVIQVVDKASGVRMY